MAFVDSFQVQIIISTMFMFGVPLSVFFSLRDYWYSTWVTEEVYNDPKKLQDVYSDIDIYSGLAAVVAVQFVIGAIIVIKYTEDIVDTFIKGTGSVPYPGQDLNKRHRTKQQALMQQREQMNVQGKVTQAEEESTEGHQDTYQQLKKKKKKKKNKKSHNRKH